MAWRVRSWGVLRSTGAILSCLLVFLTTGGANTLPSGGTRFLAQQTMLNIAFVAADMSSTFYQTMKCGAQEAAREQHINLDWQGDAQWGIQQQMPIFQAMVEKHPTGMVLAPTDPNALIEPVKELMSKGVPVVTVDGSLAQPVEVQNIRTNNTTAGAGAADALGQAIGGDGKIAIVALDPGVPANQERVDGFAKEIKSKYPKITLLPTQYSGTNQTKAAQQVAAMIQANPDLKGVYTTFSDASNGAASAILAANKRGTIKLVAYDADPQEVRDLKEGVFDALVVQNPYSEGFDSVTLVVKVLRHQVDKSSVPHQAYPKTFIATRQNIDDPSLQKYLYKTTCGS
jgi:ribose transport system substrate-binding protein